jgi:hypothetical protein
MKERFSTIKDSDLDRLNVYGKYSFYFPGSFPLENLNVVSMGKMDYRLVSMRICYSLLKIERKQVRTFPWI